MKLKSSRRLLQVLIHVELLSQFLGKENRGKKKEKTKRRQRKRKTGKTKIKIKKK